MGKLRVGILGFGAIGQYIAQRLLDPNHPDSLVDLVELVLIWNRTTSKLHAAKQEAGFEVPAEIIMETLDELFPDRATTATKFTTLPVDLLIEVCHPTIYQERGVDLLRRASLYVGSPTAFANGSVFDELSALATGKAPINGLFVPCGALWGASDIVKLGRRKGAIAEASITMTIPPHSLKLNGELGEKLEAYVKEIEAHAEKIKQSNSSATGSGDSAVTQPPEHIVLYDGFVRGLCPMAPNNVNTMACFAMATGPDMGFDRVRGRLVADRTITAHIIDVLVRGPPQKKTRIDPTTNETVEYEDTFEVASRRYNPCNPNAVTASATYPSFYASLRKIVEEMCLDVVGVDGSKEGCRLRKGLHFV